MKWKVIAAFALIAGTSTQALAQGSPPPQPSAGSPDGISVSRTTREQQEGYNRVVNEGVPITNGDRQQPVKKTRRPVAATAADIAIGAGVRDRNGVQIATVESLDANGAVLKYGDRLAKVTLEAFGKDDDGLLLGVTEDEFQAAVSQTAVPAQQEPQFVAVTPADMVPGAAIRDIDGVPIGTVAELVESGVVILADGKKVRLALESFAKDESGLLIGITASEFKAAIGTSAPANTGG